LDSSRTVAGCFGVSDGARTATQAVEPETAMARARRWLMGSQGLVALALVVGVGAGAIAFRYMILGFTEVTLTTRGRMVIPRRLSLSV
jgi:hypothetical protein